MDNLFSVQGKVAVVTGGRKGIGRAITCGLIEHGAKVIVVGKSKDANKLNEEIKNSCGSGFEYIPCDLSKPEERKDLGSSILNKCKKVDILINNAGDQERKSFLDYSQSQWERDIQLLLSAVFDLSQQVAAIMVKQGCGGKIVNVGSISSFQGANNIVGYVAAKHGLIGLTKSMAVELASHNINVNCIAPGFIETDLLGKFDFDKKTVESRIPKHGLGKPRDILGTVLYLCSNASDYVTGVMIPVDGGWLAR
ncbi:MAG: SDR family oxidoreductase [Candidatus Omnitrophica bacterium]|nr:SDR family oxidoreductase [Candidatus Omnitrophota bacterium]